MKLSNKGRYAVRALFDIAFFNSGKPTQVKDIAERQGIPPRFLEQIFQDLKKAGIVGSKRGPQGGYRLAVRSEEVRLGDVLRAVEGPVILGERTRNDSERKQRASAESLKVTEEVFGELAARIEACFDDVTIADICQRAERLGVHRPGTHRYVYVI